MKEASWLAGTDPHQMVEWLTRQLLPEGPPLSYMASQRKLRLFAVACCRATLHTSREPEVSGDLLDVAEKIADRLPLTDHERAAPGRCDRAFRRSGAIEEACRWCVQPDATVGISFVVLQARRQGSDLYQQDGATFAALLREIIGNPFQVFIRYVCKTDVHPLAAKSGVYLLDEWFTWNDGTIRSMAERIYQERDYASLPILADALQEAGCPEDSDLVKHCRGLEPCSECAGTAHIRIPRGEPSQGYEFFPCQSCDGGYVRPLHARGCFVIDLLTGRS